jgi:hypothetical protein
MEDVLFETDFEGYEVGTLPPELSIKYNGKGTEYQVVTTDEAYSGTKSFQAWGKPNWGASIFYYFTKPEHGKVGYEIMVKANPMEEGQVQLNNPDAGAWTWGWAQLGFDKDGYIVSEGGFKRAHTEDRWYKVKAEMDIDTGACWIWLDDELIVDGLTPQEAEVQNPDAYKGIRAFAFGDPSFYENPSTPTYFDDLRVYTVPEANHPPLTPDAPTGPDTGKPRTAYSFTAVTTDDDGEKISYLFDWGDGETTETDFVDSGEEVTREHAWETVGSYDVVVLATDESGDSSQWSESKMVEIVNNPPDQPAPPNGPESCDVGETCEFSAVTTDPEEDQMVYTFDWGDETTDDTGYVESGDPASGSHSWSEEGTYEIMVKATDINEAESDWSEPSGLSVEGNHAPEIPTLPDGPTESWCYVPCEYSTNAFDSDGDQVTYTFDWGDGTTTKTDFVDCGETMTQTHSWTKPGNYEVVVMATDANGKESEGWSDAAVVAIAKNGRPSTPRTPSGVNKGFTGVEYTFTTSATDPDKDQIMYIINWGDETQSETELVNSGKGASATHIWAADGEYEVTAIAVDSKGAPCEKPSKIKTVKIVMNNPPDTPDMPEGPSAGMTTVSYSFKVVTTDPDGDKMKYTVDWGDGKGSTSGTLASGKATTLTHKWSDPGNYEVIVMATDSNGLSSEWSDALVIGIVKKNTKPGKPSTPSGVSSGKVGTTYTFTTSSSDPEKNDVWFTFDWGDGTSTNTNAVKSGTKASAQHSWNAPGKYQVRATATDTEGAVSDVSNAKIVNVKL